jgi:cytochrome c biogenesis protein CcdA
MFEFFKLVWDMIVLRDSASKGQLKVRKLLLGFGFAILLYAIGVPAAVLYSKHPQYKPLFIAAIVVDALLFLSFMFFAGRDYIRTLKNPSPTDDPPASNP